MSHRIEFAYQAFAVPCPWDGRPRYLIAVQGGDNNLRDACHRIARSWEVQFLGTADEVLQQAVVFSGSCYGGSVKPMGRDASPQSYIRRIRRLLDATPASGPSPYGPSWKVRILASEQHPIVAEALMVISVAPRRIAEYGKALMVFEGVSPIDQGYWGLVSRYCGYGRLRPHLIPAWRLAEVHGLAA